MSFLRIGIDPGTMLLQFDTGSDTSDWQKAMIQANSADSTSKLKPCKYFESDMVSIHRLFQDFYLLCFQYQAD